MPNTPNKLVDMFPDKVDEMHKLKQEDGEFSHLHDDYHEINRKIHRGETDVEPMSDLHMEDLRKQRLTLLDRIKEKLA